MTLEKLTAIVKKLAAEHNALEQRLAALEADCECVVDEEDGSTIEACSLHPQGGSPKSYRLAMRWVLRAPVPPIRTTRSANNERPDFEA
jgi:hypothetical protein